MYKVRQSKFDKFYTDQSSQILQSIKSMEYIDQNNYNSSSSDLSILFLGPSGSSKSILIKSICQSMKISQGFKAQTVQTEGLILSKTQLTKPQTYKIGNQQYRQRRAISLYQFHQRISLNSLNCFSKLFDLMQQASEAMCSCKSSSQKRSGSLPIQSVILVIDVGSTLDQEQLQCMRQILNDLKEREIKPILALCTKQSPQQTSQEQKLQRIEQQIKSAHQLFSIERQSVFAIQLNENNSNLSQENSYYLLRLLEASLREATQFSSKYSNDSKLMAKKKKQSSGWSSLFFPCWG